ncbi:MAG: DNA polymerase III subunit gamma/tau [bacterium]|nr:DNA polymerase III subunit gamma/tau [bacterium]
MSYHALYRKYRPSVLEDVVGQEAVVKVIRNSLRHNRFSHAYMFSGPRGTGKTTMAKILAKSVNCLEPVDGIACEKCKNCLAIACHSVSDIIEIDAASNNGVDEIREIRNKINLVPSELRYKVYIIDEVHMLSIGAFNALLKTLEEPPEHIIFILATTDLHKVPVTIVSRCQCFDFKRFTENEIVKRLEYIVSEENILVDHFVLEEIANLADGGMRDAIGMLDKVFSYSDNRITIDDFEKINGIVSLKEKNSFLTLIEKKDVSRVIQFIDQIYNSGKDLSIFCQDLLLLCRDRIMDYYLKKDCSFDISFLLKFVDYFNKFVVDIKLSNNVKIMFEIKILSFLNLLQSVSSADTFECVSANTKGDMASSLDHTTSVGLKEKVVTTVEKRIDFDFQKYANINNIIVNNCFAKASKNQLNLIKNSWERISDYALDSEYGAIACYVVDSILRAASDNEIIITYDYDSMVNRGYANISKIEQLFEKIFGHRYRIAILSTEEWNLRKKEYIENKAKGISYECKEIPVLESKILEVATVNSSSTIMDEAIELFGDIVTSNE